MTAQERQEKFDKIDELIVNFPHYNNKDIARIMKCSDDTIRQRRIVLFPHVVSFVRRRIFDEDEVNLINEMLSNGDVLSKIAKTLRCSRETLKNYFLKEKIEFIGKIPMGGRGIGRKFVNVKKTQNKLFRLCADDLNMNIDDYKQKIKTDEKLIKHLFQFMKKRKITPIYTEIF